MFRRPTVHAHSLVVETARELCLASYESLMSNNAVRAEWKRRHPGAGEMGLQAAFVRRYLRAFVGPARSTLGGMLALPYDTAFKDRIHEALCLDNALVRGRTGAGELIDGVTNEATGLANELGALDHTRG